MKTGPHNNGYNLKSLRENGWFSILKNGFNAKTRAFLIPSTRSRLYRTVFLKLLAVLITATVKPHFISHIEKDIPMTPHRSLIKAFCLIAAAFSISFAGPQGKATATLSGGVLRIHSSSFQNGRIELLTLQGRKIFSRTLSQSNFGIDLHQLLSRYGQSPIAVRLTVDGETDISFVTKVSEGKFLLSHELFAQNKTGDDFALAKNNDGCERFTGTNGTVRQGTLDGQPITFVDYNGVWIYDGDIQLTPDNKDGNSLAKSLGAGITSSGLKWPNRTVPYTIDASLNGKTKKITDAIALYNQIGITWVSRTTETNYVCFIQTNDGTYSNVGMIGNKQFIHLEDWNTYGNCFHEMGHVLGLFHEQSRADQANWIKIYRDRIALDDKGFRDSYGTYTQMGYSGFDGKNFDWISVMLYKSFGNQTADAISKNLPTMTKLDGTTFGQQRFGTSAGDIVAFTTLYPRSSTATTDVTALSGTVLNVFRANGSGTIQTAKLNNGTWSNFATIGTGKTMSGGSVTSISRAANVLDAFTVGTDGIVLTSNWYGAAWSNWGQITGYTFDTDTKITPVSRTPLVVDLFAVGKDGFVYSTNWYGGLSSPAWTKWAKLGAKRAACGAKIDAVSRDANTLELFTVGDTGNLSFAKWVSTPAPNGTWTDFTDMGNPGQALASVTAVKSSSDRFHVFGVTLDGRIYSREWTSTTTPNWTVWNAVNGGVAAQGCKVVATSRAPGKVDAFVLGTDINAYACAWENGRDARNAYRGWWNIGSGITQGTQLSCAGKSASSLDVFVISGNGTTVWTRQYNDAGGWAAAWQPLAN
jgi:hypothetical protein